MQELRQYFKETKGSGVLVTSDSQGKVDALVFPKPIIDENGYIVFISQDAVLSKNLKENPRALFVFTEYTKPNKGIRLELVKSHEDYETEIRYSLKHQEFSKKNSATRFLYFFKLENKLPLLERGQEEN